MKRRALRLLLFLLAGAIINVAVAWGQTQYSSVVPNGIGLHWDDALPLWSRLEISPTAIHSLGGGFRVENWRGTLIGLDFRLITPESIRQHTVVWWETGFPSRSVAFIREYDKTLWIVRNWQHGQYRNVVLIWPGFAINTIFYAAVLWGGLWVLFAVPLKVRRWRRITRGQCASCGYSLRENTSEKCPECGKETDMNIEIETHESK